MTSLNDIRDRDCGPRESPQVFKYHGRSLLPALAVGHPELAEW
jgi:hypothetical protein